MDLSRNNGITDLFEFITYVFDWNFNIYDACGDFFCESQDS